MSAPDAQPGILTRLARLVAARARLLGLMVPIHLIAFIVIYVATDRLLQREVLATAEQVATERLGQAAEELYVISSAHTGERGHLFGALLQANRSIQLRLFLGNGRMMGPPIRFTPEQREQMTEFMAEPTIHRFWLDSSDDRKRVRGMLKVVSDEQCKPCHLPGATLAAATMELDLTDRIARARKGSRRNLFLLIASWAALLGLTTSLVKKSVRRSADRLEAQLAAAQSGESAPSDPGSQIVLDPVSARLHDSLRTFLDDQRQREREMATKLEHTDQLASLGKLAAGLAHEIKNPLAGIQGALEILREDLPDDGNRELCGEMLSELDRVNAILRDLLSSARPSVPHLTSVDLRGLLEDIRRLLEPGLRRKGVNLKVEIAPGSIRASVEAAKIRQVLINLINNAAEAMETEGGTGGGNITLRAGHFPEEEGAILSVQDDGPGISEEDQAKIFTPFFTTKFYGTGLGLAIARRLVEQHGGSLQVESAPGEGTTFYILLPEPAYAGEAPAEAAREPDASQPDEPAS